MKKLKKRRTRRKVSRKELKRQATSLANMTIRVNKAGPQEAKKIRRLAKQIVARHPAVF